MRKAGTVTHTANTQTRCCPPTAPRRAWGTQLAPKPHAVAAAPACSASVPDLRGVKGTNRAGKGGQGAPSPAARGGREGGRRPPGATMFARPPAVTSRGRAPPARPARPGPARLSSHAVPAPRLLPARSQAADAPRRLRPRQPCLQPPGYRRPCPAAGPRSPVPPLSGAGGTDRPPPRRGAPEGWGGHAEPVAARCGGAVGLPYTRP